MAMKPGSDGRTLCLGVIGNNPHLGTNLLRKFCGELVLVRDRAQCSFGAFKNFMRSPEFTRTSKVSPSR
jgi:hypothetical protein